MEDYEIHWGRRTRSTVTPSRHIRAVSAAPDVPEDVELDGYFLNSGLYRAKRALSEARDLLRESSSMARESSVMESRETQKLKRSQLEQIQESTAGSSAADHAMGHYKITVTPKVEETWSTSLPNREWVSPNTALTAKLLDVYNPSKYPDFIFGRYGDGDRLYKPVSATMSYMERENRPLFDRDSYLSSASKNYQHSSLEDSSSMQKTQNSQSQRATSRARSMARELTNLKDYETSTANLKSRSSMAADYDLNNSRSSYGRGLSEGRSLYDRDSSNNRYKNYYSGSYDHTTDSAYMGNKARRMFKYYHLLIPKHYPGTPMLGGYLLPNNSQYTWRY